MGIESMCTALQTRDPRVEMTAAPREPLRRGCATVWV